MVRRTVHELIDDDDPAWPLVQNWLETGRTHYEVLDPDWDRSQGVLLQLQVTTRSPLGAVALHTGGIIFDHGWLRFLGGGGERMHASLLTFTDAGDGGASPLVSGLVVALDAIGGFFVLNGGAFPGKQGAVYYLAPDTLRWEALDMRYSDLLHWASHGDLQQFYTPLRWPNWESEVSGLGADEVLSVYPPLWSGGGPVADRSRRAIPLVECWNLTRDMAEQVWDLPDGARQKPALEE